MTRPALLVALLAVGPAAAQQTDALLQFDWLSDDQRASVETAHSALAEAEAQMCEVMVDLYGRHASRVHGGGEGLPNEAIRFITRRCVAEAEMDHVAQSLAIHDMIHAELHTGAAHEHD